MLGLVFFVVVVFVIPTHKRHIFSLIYCIYLVQELLKAYAVG